MVWVLPEDPCELSVLAFILGGAHSEVIEEQVHLCAARQGRPGSLKVVQQTVGDRVTKPRDKARIEYALMCTGVTTHKSRDIC